MGFPYLLEESFSLGGRGSFNSETDTESKLDFRHYSYLARNAPLLDVPFRDAYAMHIDLSLGAADAYLEELDGFDVAANTAASMRFYLWLSTDLVMADNDIIDLLRWQSAGPVNEFTVSVVFTTAGGFQIRGGGVGVAFPISSISLGAWHCVELSINTGTGANGTADFYLDGYQVGSQVTSVASAALTQAQFGALGIDVGTTRGHLLFSSLIVDDTRVYPVRERFSGELLVTKSGHIALGPGAIERMTLLSGGTDNIVTLYDTDEAILADAGNVITAFGSGVANESMEVQQSYYFNRGCYVNLAGANPRLTVTFKQAQLSRGLVRQSGLRRKPSPV